MKHLFERESVALASVPVVAFMLAFAFEAGIADAYGFSYALINIDLKIMVGSILLVCLFAFPILVYSRFMIGLLSSRRGRDRVLGFPLFMGFMLLAVCYFSGFTRQVVLVSAIGAGSVFLILLVSIIKNGLLHGWANALDETAKSSGYKDIEKWRAAEGKPGFKDKAIADLAMLIIFFVLFGMIHGAGTAYASLRKSYEVVDVAGKKMAILAGYGDKLIFGGVEAGKFNGKITIKSSDSDDMKDIERMFIPHMLEDIRKQRTLGSE